MTSLIIPVGKAGSTSGSPGTDSPSRDQHSHRSVCVPLKTRNVNDQMSVLISTPVYILSPPFGEDFLGQNKADGDCMPCFIGKWDFLEQRSCLRIVALRL